MTTRERTNKLRQTIHKPQAKKKKKKKQKSNRRPVPNKAITGSSFKTLFYSIMLRLKAAKMWKLVN